MTSVNSAEMLHVVPSVDAGAPNWVTGTLVTGAEEQIGVFGRGIGELVAAAVANRPAVPGSGHAALRGAGAVLGEAFSSLGETVAPTTLLPGMDVPIPPGAWASPDRRAVAQFN